MPSYTSSSLTLRSLLKSAASRLRLGVPAPRVSGLTAPAKALFAAVAADRGRVLLVVPTDADIETMTRDARFFFSALEGLSETEVERAVLPFPSHEVDPYRGLAPHFDIASARARALHAVTERTAKLIVASAAALLPRLSPPARLNAVSLALAPGQDVSPTELGDILTAAGYTRQDNQFDGLFGFNTAGSLSPIRSQDNMLNFGVSVTLRTSRSGAGNVQAATARASGARMRREYLEKNIPSEVEDAYQRWRTAAESLQILQSGVLDPSTNNLAVIREAYKLGQLRLLDVLNEQRRLVETQMAYIDAQADLARTWAEVERAAGGIHP